MVPVPPPSGLVATFHQIVKFASGNFPLAHFDTHLQYNCADATGAVIAQ
jgi:hypothetical protein